MTSALVTTLTTDYKPYGNFYQKTGTVTFGYTGKLYGSTIGGLHYFGARWCDNDLGRFITQDSFAGDIKDPMSLNSERIRSSFHRRYSRAASFVWGHGCRRRPRIRCVRLQEI